MTYCGILTADVEVHVSLEQHLKLEYDITVAAWFNSLKAGGVLVL